nr:MAG TPA: hypothetical protein [Caudoviricetes sp.]
MVKHFTKICAKVNLDLLYTFIVCPVKFLFKNVPGIFQ